MQYTQETIAKENHKTMYSMTDRVESNVIFNSYNWVFYWDDVIFTGFTRQPG